MIYITDKKFLICCVRITCNYQFNPLSPNGDQDQFSPNDILTLLRDKVMRITEMITKEKML